MQHPRASLRIVATLGAFALALAATAPSRAENAPGAATSAPLQTQETNEAGVVAELTECKRKEGVLTMKVRFRNTSAADASFPVISLGRYDDTYVTAGSKKYFVLRDSEKAPLAPPTEPSGSVTVRLKPGATWTWWAKYPAPPADVKAVNYVMTVAPPFEDVPISDM